MEEFKTIDIAQTEKGMETVPESFPIVEVEGSFSVEHEPDFIEDTIVKFKLGSITEGADKYALLRDIGGYKYTFKLYQEYGNPKSTTWVLVFKTQDYGYATTNLDDNGRMEVFQSISAFFDSVQADVGGEVKIIDASPADVKYTAEEVEACAQAILESKRNKLNREQLLKVYSGIKLFDYYKKITGKSFEVGRDFRESGGAIARSRLFRMMFKKYLKNWEVDEASSGYDLYLKPKI
ncbi:MAG: hypothetical protein V4690_01845 [Patescibacteria group bacterium]